MEAENFERATQHAGVVAHGAGRRGGLLHQRCVLLRDAVQIRHSLVRLRNAFGVPTTSGGDQKSPGWLVGAGRSLDLGGV